MRESEQSNNKTDIPPVPEAYLLHGPQTEAERRDRERQKYQEERDGKEDAYKSRQLDINQGQLAANRRIAWYTLVLAVLSILGLLISFLSSQAAKESADAAKKAADTATETLKEMRTSSDQTNAQVNKIISNLDSVANSGRSSAQRALDALSLSRDQFKRDQRPYVWLTVNGTGGPEYRMFVTNRPSAGQIVWSYHYTNYGKSPAQSLLSRRYIKCGTEGIFRNSYNGAVGGHNLAQRNEGVPLPVSKDDFGTVISAPEISREAFDSLVVTDHAIEVKIVFTYTDSYGAKYETGVCLSRLGSGATQYCRAGNYIK